MKERLLELLEASGDGPVIQLLRRRLLDGDASKRSAGGVLTCQGKEWKVEELTTESSFAGVDFALISATDAISREYGAKLGTAGVVVIDDSGVFRMEEDVPLVVPEVNAHALDTMPRGIVAIPNCTTTPLVMALKPLQDAVGVRRVVVTTFQSVSGTGAAAMDELMTQTKDLMAFRDPKVEVYPYQIAFNLLPHIGSFNEGGDCSEEVKIAKETRKILGTPHEGWLYLLGRWREYGDLHHVRRCSRA